VQDLITDLRDGEVLHVLLLALFGPGTPAHSDAKLPPLPPPPKGGGALSGSGAAALRQSAVKQQLAWLQTAFGPAAGLDVVYFSLSSSLSSDDSQAPSPSTAASSSSSSSSSAATSSSKLGALELEESDAEDALPDSDGSVPESSSSGGGTKASSPTVTGTGKAAAGAAAAATDKMLDGLAFAISSGSDGAATVGVVWACAQCWCAHGCLASRAPSYAACLAPQLPPPSPASLSNIVPASGTHDGLKEWLLAYFAALASIGARVPLPPPPPLLPASPVSAPSASSSKSVGSAAASLEDVDIQSGGAADSSNGSTVAAAGQTYSSGANCPGKHGLSTFKTTNNSWWCRYMCGWVLEYNVRVVVQVHVCVGARI